MSPLQWALLVVGAVAVIAVYVYSRRDREPKRARATPPPPPLPTAPLSGQSTDQMEMFSRLGDFDELGVGKPRKRVALSVAGAQPEGGAAQQPVEERLVAVLIAEREGTAIFGPKIHAALRAQGLKFGERKIYHRTEGSQIVFSVACLIKPGHLDPAEQQSFSTPGLSVFMMLPGPVAAETAIGDMLGTARALAQQLNAEVFDSDRQPLTPMAEKQLMTDIRNWARQHGL